jgi:hypothetical protein
MAASAGPPCHRTIRRCQPMRLTATASAFLIGIGLATPVSAGTATTSKLVSLDSGGSAPTGAEQSAKWTRAQLQTYADKLQYADAVAAASGQPSVKPYRPANLPKPLRSGSATTPMMTPSCPIDGCKPASASLPGVLNDPEPNSYYGYQCGPAAGHNALGAYGVNVAVGTGSYPNATGLTQQMQTTSSQGTYRGPMPAALNSHESQNTYVWQNITLNWQSGGSDVNYYSSTDIWVGDSPIYNITTYGKDPSTGRYGYPFQQYSTNISHYVAAYAYTNSGAYISISDSAVQYSHTASQRYTQYEYNIWWAINNNPNYNQILW